MANLKKYGQMNHMNLYGKTVWICYATLYYVSTSWSTNLQLLAVYPSRKGQNYNVIATPTILTSARYNFAQTTKAPQCIGRNRINRAAWYHIYHLILWVTLLANSNDHFWHSYLSIIYKLIAVCAMICCNMITLIMFDFDNHIEAKKANMHTISNRFTYSPATIKLA